jgi:ribonuclease HI
VQNITSRQTGAKHYLGPSTNIAEYESIILGLRKIRALRIKTCIVKIGSKIVTGQIEKDYAAWEPVLL